MNDPKPKVFIASSNEGRHIAHSLHSLLEYEADVTTWTNETFHLSNSTAEDLAEKSSNVDFAIFVFHPDDAAEIRGEKKHIVRDNVIFELGLFIGAIGRNRCYMVRPRGVELHIPSDLVGLTLADYNPLRIEAETESALIPSSTKIKAELKRHGPRDRMIVTSAGLVAIRKANPPQYELIDDDFDLLAAAAASDVSVPSGVSMWNLSNSLRGWSESQIHFSALKLLRMGYIEKKISEDRDGEPYFSMFITDDGIETLLSRPRATARPVPVPKQPGKPAPNFSDMDDDVPF